MKKRIIYLFAFLLIFTACGGKETKDSDANKRQDRVSEENLSSKDQDKEKEGPYADIYKDLKGIKLANMGAGSAIEAIYFYKDGYFDGGFKTGNDVYRGIGLYNGKFNIIEKIDENSYKLKLVRLDYDTPTGKEDRKNYDGLDAEITYLESPMFTKDNLGDEYTLYLPNTKMSTYNEDQKTGLMMNGIDTDSEKLGSYVLAEDLYMLVEFVQ